ncbi:ribosomal protein S18-alanine N-acetyltransferase [Metabacillus arenae]|uniref:[Ribosomal protein bS18]-alanine N-acetyltransferase n=1 Tax=Metabacillus arenae TaxID=2771434 RepID=A0A926NM53_9BACI|nr:ribosomal protein S18-alanine N-acetyltransferase [Metabacillus arenae]MBD1383158.1 ribosomal protein S18-alanine N-acetyltransferase [Metabacillus arenae]
MVDIGKESIIIRLMTMADIDKVYEIEKHSFSTPWTRESFYNEISYNNFATYLVIEYNNEIAGYCGLWVIFDDAQITNIAISPEFRGRGLGETLLGAAIEGAKKLGANRLSLEVRMSNTIAQALYKKHGFQSGGIRKNYYTDNQEDALLMWVKLS